VGRSICIEERALQAVKNFESGYNCSQSLFLAYADLFDLPPSLANQLSVSFGGGVGRMREICGAVSAMSMLIGLHHPESVADDMKTRIQIYTAVQEASSRFKEKYNSIICKKLLSKTEAAKREPIPSLRTTEYYAKRPCSKYIAEAACIIGKILSEEIKPVI